MKYPTFVREFLEFGWAWIWKGRPWGRRDFALRAAWNSSHSAWLRWTTSISGTWELLKNHSLRCFQMLHRIYADSSRRLWFRSSWLRLHSSIHQLEKSFVRAVSLSQWTAASFQIVWDLGQWKKRCSKVSEAAPQTCKFRPAEHLSTLSDSRWEGFYEKHATKSASPCL